MNFLDEEYKAAMLDEVIKMCENLSQKEQHQLQQVIHKYEHLFDRTIGEFNLEPISIQWMDKGCKSFYALLYTIPRSVQL